LKGIKRERHRNHEGRRLETLDLTKKRGGKLLTSWSGRGGKSTSVEGGEKREGKKNLRVKDGTKEKGGGVKWEKIGEGPRWGNGTECKPLQATTTKGCRGGGGEKRPGNNRGKGYGNFGLRGGMTGKRACRAEV